MSKLQMKAMGLKMNNPVKQLLKKDKGDATLIVTIALIVFVLILVVLFKDTIFERIKEAISSLGADMDNVFNLN